MAEPESPTRTAYQRDRDRIIHSTAFRRLAHKTQVFIAHESDHFRTRLTHTLEVVQIARAIARALKGDEDLAETIALAHDFGHTPFGHAGERALDGRLQAWGGFDHNVQTLRVVTRLERRYALFDGLNLTWETLEGLAKHNGPIGNATHISQLGDLLGNFGVSSQPDYTIHATLEAQAAALADDIAYNSHDIDDGLRSGLLTLEMLETVTLPGRIMKAVRNRYPKLDETRTASEFMRRQITLMVEDVIAQSRERLADIRADSPDSVRHAGFPVVSLSDSMRKSEREIRKFLHDNLYRHEQVMGVMRAAETVVCDLYDAYMAEPSLMPPEWYQSLSEGARGLNETRRAVTDFLAGMTDSFALTEHRRLFDHTPKLR